MLLHQLEKAPGARHRRRRVGRGPGSTFGKTSARGQKGQHARNTVAPGFEGGQTPLRRRLPRRGFKSLFKTQFATVNLRELEKRPDLSGLSEIGPEELIAAKVINKTDKVLDEGTIETRRVTRFPVKILGDGEITRAVTVKAHFFTKSAIEKIEKAGGKAVVLEK